MSSPPISRKALCTALPPTARRLLVHPLTGEVFVGSSEGLVVIAPAETLGAGDK